MQYIRTTLFYILMTLYTIPHVLLGALLLLFLPFRARYLYLTTWNKVALFMLKWLCGLSYQVTGLNNIPTTQACVVLCKHQSIWETIFLQTQFAPLCTILKKELLMWPFFGWGLKWIRPIAIDRSNKKKAIKQVLQEGRKKVEEGISVLVFPEGTRAKVGETLKFARSGANIAVTSNVSALPIAHNAGLFWDPSRFLIYPGTIEVVIGPLLDSKDKLAKELNDSAQKWVEITMQKLSQQSSFAAKHLD